MFTMKKSGHVILAPSNGTSVTAHEVFTPHEKNVNDKPLTQSIKTRIFEVKTQWTRGSLVCRSVVVLLLKIRFAPGSLC